MIPLHRIGISFKEYLLKILLPSVLSTSIIGYILYSIVLKNFGTIKLVSLFFPFFGLFIAIIYPYIVIDSKKNEIDSRMHIFITNFGVLSKTDVDRRYILKLLSQKKELGYLAKEIYKIYVLIDRWNQSIAKAARFLSKRTPSRVLSDFLDRFAHSQDSGESMESFLTKEQEIVMNEYSTYYKGALYEIDIFKEIYSAILLSLAFLMAFIIIVPLLIGEDILRLSLYAALFFIIVEVAIVYFIKSIVPFDPLWHSHDILTHVDKKLLLSFGISILGVITFAVLSYIFRDVIKNVPFQFIVAGIVTPLLYSGYVARKEENILKRKDENFPSFLRTLGSSASARGGLILDPLYYLTAHDFGPLTQDIKNLYKRLVLRIDMMRSWKFFSAETGSHLIDTFSKLFVESLNLGGEPGEIADTISSNIEKIISLRRQKFQVTSSFIGIIYGVTAGVAFSVAISFTVAMVINKIFMSLNLGSLSTVSNILYVTPTSNFVLVSIIMFSLMVIHSLLSAVLVRIIDGGHYLNSLIHFVFLVWTSAIVIFISEKVVNSLISIQY